MTQSFMHAARWPEMMTDQLPLPVVQLIGKYSRRVGVQYDEHITHFTLNCLLLYIFSEICLSFNLLSDEWEETTLPLQKVLSSLIHLCKSLLRKQDWEYYFMHATDMNMRNASEQNLGNTRFNTSAKLVIILFWWGEQ